MTQTLTEASQYKHSDEQEVLTKTKIAIKQTTIFSPRFILYKIKMQLFHMPTLIFNPDFQYY